MKVTGLMLKETFVKLDSTAPVYDMYLNAFRFDTL